MEPVHYKPLLCFGGDAHPRKPLESAEIANVTLTEFLNTMKIPFELSRLIIAISIAVKTVSANLRKKANSGTKLLGFDSVVEKVSEADICNGIFLQMIKDTGAVFQVGCPLYPKSITFDSYPDAQYVVNFSAHDCLPNLPTTSCCSSAFAILKEDPDSDVTDHALQPGKNIIVSGYAVYGHGTVFYISVAPNQVDGFLLDPLVGELFLTDKNVRIPDSGVLYTINEGMSFYYSQKILDWLEMKKNPEGALGARMRYAVSKIADTHRILRNGGIYCHPKSKFMDSKCPHRLVYECQPLGHLITQAGGLATDGKSWLMDVTPKELHGTTPLYLGSSNEVLFLLSFLNPKLVKSYASGSEKEEE